MLGKLLCLGIRFGLIYNNGISITYLFVVVFFYYLLYIYSLFNLFVYFSYFFILCILHSCIFVLSFGVWNKVY